MMRSKAGAPGAGAEVDRSKRALFACLNSLNGLGLNLANFLKAVKRKVTSGHNVPKVEV
jgi:hypothetical protein